MSWFGKRREVAEPPLPSPVTIKVKFGILTTAGHAGGGEVTISVTSGIMYSIDGKDPIFLGPGDSVDISLPCILHWPIKDLIEGVEDFGQ